MVGRLQPGTLVSRGNTSDVWEWSPTTVVKILRPGVPERWARLEAEITSRVHAAGLPAPAVDGLVVVGGRPGIVLQRIHGTTMWDRIESEPAEALTLMTTLVTLQEDLHATASLAGIPEMSTRVTTKVSEATALPACERETASAVFEALPVGASLCHGDLHPRNVILSDRGITVVDWFDATNGHPMADRARTSLLLRPAMAAGASHLPGSTAALTGRLRRCYLDELARRGLMRHGDFDTWEAVLAVARMAEPVETDGLRRLWDEWRRGGHPDPALVQ